MALSNSLYSGLSGLSAMSRSIAVTSDNIANVNTVGHRGSRSQFEDLLAQNLPGVGDLGSGVRLSRIEKLFQQGAIVGSARSTDLAIQGRGMFVLDGTYNGLSGNFFTRAGQFSADAEGFLVREGQLGLRLQGYQADANGEIGTVVGDLRAATRNISPQQTSGVDLAVQLPVNGEDGNILPPTPGGFDINDIEGSTDASTSLTVYDSLGNAHQVSVFFTKTGVDPVSGESTWAWTATAPGDEVEGGTPGQPFVFAEGTVSFNSDGQLLTETQVSNTIQFAGGAASQTIDFDFGDSLGTDGATDAAGSTQFAQPFSVNDINQDGYAPGEFTGFDIDLDGTIRANYDNNQVLTIGQVALADFTNQEGLRRNGGTLFSETLESGQPLIGFANSGGRGQILGGALEQSNVDLSTQFVNLINDQRAFQASTRTITTADELLAETINIKR